MQCQNCGTMNSVGSEYCSCCSKPLRAPAPAPAPTSATASKYNELVDHELAAPPRSVPTELKMAARKLDLGMAISGGVAVLLRLIGPPPLNTAGVSMGIGALVLLGFLLMRRRALWLLGHGIAGRAEVLQSTSRVSMSATHARRATGWDVQTTRYSGPAYVTQLRLWGPDGQSATFRKGGLLGDLGYDGGIFLYDPQDPARHQAIESYGVPLRPKNGQWKVWPAARNVVLVKTGVALGILGVTLYLALGVL